MKKQDKQPTVQGAFITADEIKVTGTMTNTSNKIKFSKDRGKEVTGLYRDPLMYRLAVEKEKQDLSIPHQSYILARKITAKDMHNIDVDIEAIDEEEKVMSDGPVSSFASNINPGQGGGHFASQPVLTSLHAVEVKGIIYSKEEEKIHVIDVDYVDLPLNENERLALQIVIQNEGKKIFGYIPDSAVVEEDCIIQLSFKSERAAKKCQKLIEQEVLRLHESLKFAAFPGTSPPLNVGHTGGGERKKLSGSSDDTPTQTNLAKINGNVYAEKFSATREAYNNCSFHYYSLSTQDEEDKLQSALTGFSTENKNFDKKEENLSHNSGNSDERVNIVKRYLACEPKGSFNEFFTKCVSSSHHVFGKNNDKANCETLTLEGEDLSEADFSRAKFSNAILSSCTFTNTKLHLTLLDCADISKATGLSPKELAKSKFSSLNATDSETKKVIRTAMEWKPLFNFSRILMKYNNLQDLEPKITEKHWKELQSLKKNDMVQPLFKNT
ncbi:MAG: pentapeptide repeat-containing protein [Gammaproteobacteria bacterium]|nr:pentapeptide repeat-containing protein [Gammaproteobacteria bacterium]